MRFVLLLCFILPLLAGAESAAAPVFLVDEDDVRHGPFDLSAKAELPLRGHVYRIEGLPSKDNKTFTYILLSATLVDPNGEAIPTRQDPP